MSSEDEDIESFEERGPHQDVGMKAGEDIVHQIPNQEEGDITEVPMNPLSISLLDKILFSIVFIFSIAAFSLGDRMLSVGLSATVSSGFKLTELRWAQQAGLVTATASGFMYGHLNRYFGTRNVLVASTAVFIVGEGLSLLSSQHLYVAILMRAIAGFSAGGALPLAFISVTKSFPDYGERAAQIAPLAFVYIAAFIFGPLIGTLVGIWLFLVPLIIAVVVIPAAFILFRESSPFRFPNNKKKPDWIGVSLLVVGVGFLIIGIVWSGIPPQTNGATSPSTTSSSSHVYSFAESDLDPIENKAESFFLDCSGPKTNETVEADSDQTSQSGWGALTGVFVSSGLALLSYIAHSRSKSNAKSEKNKTDTPPDKTDTPPNMTDTPPDKTDTPSNMTDTPPPASALDVFRNKAFITIFIIEILFGAVFSAVQGYMPYYFSPLVTCSESTYSKLRMLPSLFGPFLASFSLPGFLSEKRKLHRPLILFGGAIMLIGVLILTVYVTMSSSDASILNSFSLGIVCTGALIIILLTTLWAGDECKVINTEDTLTDIVMGLTSAFWQLGTTLGSTISKSVFSNTLAQNLNNSTLAQMIVDSGAIPTNMVTDPVINAYEGSLGLVYESICIPVCALGFVISLVYWLLWRRGSEVTEEKTT